MTARDARRWLEDRIEETRFLDDYPHYAPTLARLNVVDDVHCGLMAVSLRGEQLTLHVHIAALEALPDGFRGVLQHELHHVLCGHVTDPRFRALSEQSILQVAAEISANEYITEVLPGSPLVWQDYAEHGIRPGQSTFQRYVLLRQARDEGRWNPPRSLSLRCCGGGRDARVREDPILGTGSIGSHSALIQELLQELRLTETLEVSGPAESRLPWRVELRAFTRADIERRPSFRRISRRDPARSRVGEVPGWRFTPGRRRLVVAIDTSSSMPDELFPHIAAELQAIAVEAELHVVECDTKIRREYAYAGRLESVEGRGGTDLRPVFAPNVLERLRPDGVVYFTDGRGSTPEEDPGVKTLWVLTGDEPFACGFGARVRMVT